ncbi:hypothetical protein CRUP_010729 [Coryphaenoides rupestris]|nr:hypothetical protein CRUP_010729 [Coryphaenoides rupestris]
MSVTTAELGETVTLYCADLPAKRDGLVWHRQSSGCIPQIVATKVYATITTHPPFDSRFTAGKVDSDFTLTIRNVMKGDEGNYFCQQEYSNNWINGTFLSVKGWTTVTSAKENKSCVYTLPKNNVDTSDAGTYYCALAACGGIVFGNGTKLDIKGTQSASYNTAHDSVNKDGETDSLNYAALEFSDRKTKGRKKNKERTQESLYSAVRESGH